MDFLDAFLCVLVNRFMNIDSRFSKFQQGKIVNGLMQDVSPVSPLAGSLDKYRVCPALHYVSKNRKIVEAPVCSYKQLTYTQDPSINITNCPEKLALYIL